MPLTPVVTIDRTQLLQLAANPEIAALAPAVKSLLAVRRQQTSCGRCGGAKRRIVSVSAADVENAKRQLASLLPKSARLRQLVKSVLQAETARLKYLRAGSQTVIITRVKL